MTTFSYDIWSYTNVSFRIQEFIFIFISIIKRILYLSPSFSLPCISLSISHCLCQCVSVDVLNSNLFLLYRISHRFTNIIQWVCLCACSFICECPTNWTLRIFVIITTTPAHSLFAYGNSIPLSHKQTNKIMRFLCMLCVYDNMIHYQVKLLWFFATFHNNNRMANCGRAENGHESW